MSFWRWFSLVWRFEGFYSICLCVRQSDFGVYQAWPNIERNVSIAQREMCPLRREEHVHCAERIVSIVQNSSRHVGPVKCHSVWYRRCRCKSGLYFCLLLFFLFFSQLRATPGVLYTCRMCAGPCQTALNSDHVKLH